MAIIVTCINPDCGAQFETFQTRINAGGGKYCNRRCFEHVQNADNLKREQAVIEFYTHFPFATTDDCAAVTGYDLKQIQAMKKKLTDKLRSHYKEVWKTWRSSPNA